MSRFFPHERMRAQQDVLVAEALKTFQNGNQLVVHAPTGLGKTAATLAPAVEVAMEKNKVVIFTTSRLTQHALAMETASMIGQKHNLPIKVVDLIGKKHMCLQPGVSGLGGKEFAEYCKAMREDGLCEYYERLKRGDETSPIAAQALVQLGKTSPNSPEHVKMLAAQDEHRLCPYELTMLLAADSTIVITDYSYLFNSKIRDGFFGRIGRRLEDCILIIDEGHNLTDRVKSLASERITSNTLKRTRKELEQNGRSDRAHWITEIEDLLGRLAQGTDDERFVTKEEFMEGLRRICSPQELIKILNEIATTVREEQKSSSAGALADFLKAWQEEKEGFTRILSAMREDVPASQSTLNAATQTRQVLHVSLSYRCLDAGEVTSPVFDSAYSTLVMSGTLTPVAMYAETLGLRGADTLTLKSPFPHANRLNLVIPKTTTKYKSRGEAMYRQIAQACAQIANTVPGNSAVFFPSYAVLDAVVPFIERAVEKTTFREHPDLGKQDREELLDRFRSYSKSGAVLLGVMGGSFSEGIDLPGNDLRAVVIVGLPLGRPDLETKALIDYYDSKFGKGWEYGYTFPAFNKTLQSAGRCIRTETDRGVIVFLDERYAWQNYYKCFPAEWDIKLTLRYEKMIEEFFRG